MLQLLSRRWWGVTGWGYLLSLALAAGLFWLLPTSSAIHCWTFEGTVRFVGFTRHRHSIIIATANNEQTQVYELDVIAGGMSAWSAVDNAKGSDLLKPVSLPFRLSLTGYLNGKSPSELVLKNKEDGSERNIPCTKYQLNIQDVAACHGGRYFENVDLSTSGRVAMSENEQWLIMTCSKMQSWLPIVNWLKEHDYRTPACLSDGFSYSAILVNLRTNEQTTCEIHTRQTPEIAISPDEAGFAVIDVDRLFLNVPDSKGRSTISWYRLPLGPVHHSFGQWCIIFAAFGLPVVLSMFWNVLRRKRRAPVPVPPHP